MRRAISIKMNPALASRKRALIFPIPVETALADAERTRRSPQGAEALRSDLAEAETPEAWELEGMRRADQSSRQRELTARRDAIERELDRAERLRQSPEGLAKLNEDVRQQQGKKESTLSAGEQAAATPGRTFLYTIQRPEVHNGRTIPGYIQIDEFIDGENTRSTNIADLKKEGIEIPEPPASLPRGQYTLEQIRWRPLP
jgi:hypothetical protein